jgi:hypothetical protein
MGTAHGHYSIVHKHDHHHHHSPNCDHEKVSKKYKTIDIINNHKLPARTIEKDEVPENIEMQNVYYNQNKEIYNQIQQTRIVPSNVIISKDAINNFSARDY